MSKLGPGTLWFSFLLLFLMIPGHSCTAAWDEWWGYQGISGPDFWGLINSDWHLCNKGRRQSPVDITPATLLHDPDLRPVLIDKHTISGTLINNGHSIVFHVHGEGETSETGEPVAGHSHTSGISDRSQQQQERVTIRAGPLSYHYQFDSIYLHFGRTDEQGSEHTISGLAFPAELQIIAYNSDLYGSFNEAASKANGLLAISLLIQVGNTSSSELRVLTSQVHHIRFRGQNVTVRSLSVHDLVPDLDSYMTYEGSLTIPGCQETVTWLVMNKPIFITRQQLLLLRKLMQGEPETPKAPLGDNFRPVHSLNHRVVRTNIDFKRKQGTECPTMKRNMNYQVNVKHIRT